MSAEARRLTCDLDPCRQVPFWMKFKDKEEERKYWIGVEKDLGWYIDDEATVEDQSAKNKDRRVVHR